MFDLKAEEVATRLISHHMITHIPINVASEFGGCKCAAGMLSVDSEHEVLVFLQERLPLLNSESLQLCRSTAFDVRSTATPMCKRPQWTAASENCFQASRRCFMWLILQGLSRIYVRVYKWAQVGEVRWEKI